MRRLHVLAGLLPCLLILPLFTATGVGGVSFEGTSASKARCSVESSGIGCFTGEKRIEVSSFVIA